MDFLSTHEATYKHRAFGPNTQVINGQLVPLMSQDQWSPVAYGPIPGRTGSPAPVPTLPPIVGGSSGYGAPHIMGGGNTANDAVAGMAGERPFDLRLSPLPWALGFLILGLLGLRWVHWR